MQGNGNVVMGQAAAFRLQGNWNAAIGSYAGNNGIGDQNAYLGVSSGRAANGSNNVCVSMLTVGPRLTKYIGAGSEVEVSFAVAAGTPGDRVIIRTTLAGLSAALAAI